LKSTWRELLVFVVDCVCEGCYRATDSDQDTLVLEVNIGDGELV